MAITWKRSEDVVWEDIQGEALLIRPATGQRWTLNAAAASVWKLCDGTHTLSHVARTMRQSKESIAHFCQQFAAMGLLSSGNAGVGDMVVSRTALQNPFSYQAQGLGTGPRRRPSPRGNSGPG